MTSALSQVEFNVNKGSHTPERITLTEVLQRHAKRLRQLDKPVVHDLM